MQVAILAGGLATRLGDLARNQPKSMVEIEGRPFLEYQLEFLKQGGVLDVVLCIGHLGEQIQRHFDHGSRFGVNIRYSIEENPLGTAGALKKAVPLLEDEFFTLYGDSYLFVDYRQVMSYFQSQNKLGLMTVYENHNCWDKSNVAIEGNLVKTYSKKNQTQDMVFLDYGLNVLKKQALDLVPKNQFFPLEELFPLLIERRELLAYEVKKRFFEIGSLQGMCDCRDYICKECVGKAE